MDQGYVFGRKGDTYIMLRAMSDGNGTLSFKNDMSGVSAEDIATDMSKIKDNVRELIEASGDLRYDLIFEGGKSHAWVTELGSIAENGSFTQFVNQMLANECNYNDMTVSYKSGEKLFNVKYNEHFMINGQVIDTNYARYENSYIAKGSIERKSDEIALDWNGYYLLLDYKQGLREYGVILAD